MYRNKYLQESIKEMISTECKQIKEENLNRKEYNEETMP